MYLDWGKGTLAEDGTGEWSFSDFSEEQIFADEQLKLYPLLPQS